MQAERDPGISFGNKLRFYGSLLATTGVAGLAAAGCGGGEQSGSAGEPVNPQGNTPEMPEGARPNHETTYPSEQPTESPESTSEESSASSDDEYETPVHSVIAVVNDSSEADFNSPATEYLKLGDNIDLEGLEGKCQELAAEGVAKGESWYAILPFLTEAGKVAAYHCFQPGQDVSYLKEGGL